MVVNVGVFVVNYDNGYIGNVIKVDFMSFVVINVMKWVKENIDYGDFMNFGLGGNVVVNEVVFFLVGYLGIFM